MAVPSPTVNSPTVIDDDICRTIDNILKAATISNNNNNNNSGGSGGGGGGGSSGGGRGEEDSSKQQQQQQKQQQPQQQREENKLSSDVYARLMESLPAAMQLERNGWKEKLHTTLQEIDRHHRASIAVQCSLQDLVDNLGIVPLISPKSDSSNNGRQSTDIIAGLQTYVHDLQATVVKANRDTSLHVKLKNMQVSLTQLEKEKSEHVSTIKEKSKEIHWLQKELNGIKHQLHKLRKIVLNYNESHSSKFHLDDVEMPKDALPEGTLRGANTLSRERAYVEGDQLDYFATPGEEIALWKLRAKQHVTDPRGRANMRTGIAQCLRCQQLFKHNENNAMACRYHKKGREIREQYDNTGRLTKVVYKWACCKRGLDVPGCTYGYHI